MDTTDFLLLNLRSIYFSLVGLMGIDFTTGHIFCSVFQEAKLIWGTPLIWIQAQVRSLRDGLNLN